MVEIASPAAPQNQRTTRPEGTLKTQRITDLTPQERQWTDNVLKVLKLPNKGSQARIIAGAIAGAEVIAQDAAHPHASQQKKADALRAEQLKNTVLSAGDPPWKDLSLAEAATAAKVELDLLSTRSKEIVPIDAGGGNVNSAFWVNRTDADGIGRASFLCKPASDQSQVDGVPDGGEVIRESLASRAAQHFARLTGIDIGMPESHVIDLPAGNLPANARPQNANTVTCSVQEARESSGMLRSLGELQLDNIPAEQVAALAIFDTMTLNTDRHSKNVMIGQNNSLIPIDHGASFCEPAQPGVFKRVEMALSTPHNALLRIPGAHEPLSKEMAKKLSAMESSSYGNSLREDRDTIANAHPGQANLLSDDAIMAAQRSARFVKLAARNKPALSPAAIQVALGGNARRLFDPQLSERQFDALAINILGKVAQRQEVIKEVCTSGDVDFQMLAKQVEALGWFVKGRDDPPGGNPAVLVTDPLLMLSIVSQVPPLGAPNDTQGKQAALNNLRQNPSSQADMLSKLATLRAANARALALCLPQPQRNMFLDRINAVANLPPQDRPRDYSIVIDSIAASLRQLQQQTLDDLRRRYVFPQVDGEVTWMETGWLKNDLIDANDHLKVIIQRAGSGYYPPVQPQQQNAPQQGAQN